MRNTFQTLWLFIFALIFSSSHCIPAPVKQEISALKTLREQFVKYPIQDNTDINLLWTDYNQIVNKSPWGKTIIFVIGKNTTPKCNRAQFFFMQYKDDKWIVRYYIAEIYGGYAGFAPIGEKREGDGRTPSGLFALGELFTNLSYYPELAPWQAELNRLGSHCGKCYITDADSLSCYDGHVNEILKIGDTARYLPPGFSGNDYLTAQGEVIKFFPGERLSFKDYKRVSLINYNYGPGRDIDKGSAILFHFDDEKHRTAGCLALPPQNMEEVFPLLFAGLPILIAPDYATAFTISQENKLPSLLQTALETLQQKYP